MRKTFMAALHAMAELTATFYCNGCGSPYPTYSGAMACALTHHRDKYGK